MRKVPSWGNEQLSTWKCSANALTISGLTICVAILSIRIMSSWHMSVIPIELGYANQYSQEKKKKNRQDFRSQILLQILEIFVYSISLNQAIICGLSAT